MLGTRLMNIFVHRTPMKQCIEFYAHNESGEYLLPVTISTAPLDSSVTADPFMSLRREEVQMLIDELWNAGFRPTDVGTAGQLGAVEEHLQDMRSLVFDTLLPIVERPPLILPKPSALCGDVLDEKGRVIRKD